MFLYYITATVHVIVCVILILVVLLQSGKGADLSGAFGGGATQTAFGARGPASFLSKMTTIAAVVFMITNISLVMLSRGTAVGTGASSVLEKTKAAGKPAATVPAKQQAPVTAPTPEQIRQQQEAIEAKMKQQSAQPAAPAKAAGSESEKPAAKK
jgi:preprotein translocase subunit SecG